MQNYKLIKKYILLIALFMSSNFASCQLAMFKWEDKTCFSESEFDSTVYSRKQIENSYEYTVLENMAVFPANVFTVIIEEKEGSRIQKM